MTPAHEASEADLKWMRVQLWLMLPFILVVCLVMEGPGWVYDLYRNYWFKYWNPTRYQLETWAAMEWVRAQIKDDDYLDKNHPGWRKELPP